MRIHQQFMQMESRTSTPAATQMLQLKPRIGSANDPLEHEADQVADAVVSNQALSTGAVLVAAAGGIQRECPACEAQERDTVRLQLDEQEEDEEIQLKSDPTSATGSAGAAAAASAVSGEGAALSPMARSYFEPHFGHDFSGVRVHTHPRAQRAAAAIGARAFTLGRDIGFASGEYAPQSVAGRHLLAHELTHVVQQEATTAPVIRRATYGSGTPPTFSNRTIATVPQDERPRVDESMAIIDRVVNDSEGFSECHDHFADRCPSGSSTTLASIWSRATIWRITDVGASENAKGKVNGSHMAFTKRGYGQGAEGLARTLLHEAGHNCGIPGGDTHWHAAQISTYCIGAGRNEVSVSGGANVGGESAIIMFSYRRFLGDWVSGRLRMTLGADLNVMGAAIEGSDDSLDTPAERRTPAEFGSAMVGAQMRLGGFGGSRFGGIGARLETGFGVGRFALRPATRGDTASTTIAPAWVLQVGPRAEFLIPFGDAHVFPLSISAAYRLAQPLNSDAQALHGLLGSVELRF